MKRISIISFLLVGSLLITLLYSCIKDGLAGNDKNPATVYIQETGTKNSFVHPDSGCTICSKKKEIILTPANFLGPFTTLGVEMNAKYGRATISDVGVQEYKKINVTMMDKQGYETAIPFFNMAADGSYESIMYKRVSSVLMIYYVRFDKSTNVFTFKPVNNLTVKYAVSFIQ